MIIKERMNGRKRERREEFAMLVRKERERERERERGKM